MNTDYFAHESTGVVQFDPGNGTRHFQPWWALLLCDRGIIDYYSWLLLRYGIALHKGSNWGPHITIVRSEEPPDKTAWGVDPGPVAFRYSNVVRWDNGRHAWLDVWSPQLALLRVSLGFQGPLKESFHLTLGRLVFSTDSEKTAVEGELTV